jgi:hypothetical protein
MYEKLSIMTIPSLRTVGGAEMRMMLMRTHWGEAERSDSSLDS